jgi:hypothetical protein
MLGSFNRMFGQKQPPKGGPLIPEDVSSPVAPQAQRTTAASGGGPVYSKVFRWRLPDGQTAEPKKVEVAGSFNHWQPVELMRDGVLDAWHVTIHHIPGGKTHHYMYLVDGKPTYDKNCDGLAAPSGPQEEKFALSTPRGPRVFMLFAQTK